MRRYLVILKSMPSFREIFHQLKPIYFIVVFVLYSFTVICGYKTHANHHLNLDLEALESSFNKFLEHNFNIMQYLGKIIVERKLPGNIEALSAFLKDVQNLAIFSNEQNFLNLSNILWSFNTSILGSSGIVDKKVVSLEESLLDACSKQPGKVLLSRWYVNQIFSHVEHIDTCLHIADSKNVNSGTLLLHFSAKDLFGYIVPDVISKKYDLVVLDQNFAPILLNIDRKLLDKLNKNMFSNKKKGYINIEGNKKAHFYKFKDAPYITLVYAKAQWYEPIIKIIKYFPLVILLYIMCIFLIIWQKNIAFHSNKRMLCTLKKIIQPSIFSTSYPTHSLKSSLADFRLLVELTKEKQRKLKSYEKKILILESSLEERTLACSHLEKKLQELNSIIDLIKHYNIENFKFRKHIGEYLRIFILNTITKSETLVKSNERKPIPSINAVQKNELLRQINKDLKSIFNFMISSKKQWIELTAVITEALSSIMIYAVLRNIEVRTCFKISNDKMYLNKVYLQLIIINLVFQSIDDSPSNSIVLITTEKILLDNQYFLKIEIKDDAYQGYNIIKHPQSSFEFERIGLENINLLVKKEGGMLELNQHLNKGKTINILFPYISNKSKNDSTENNNVYKLF